MPTTGLTPKETVEAKLIAEQVVIAAKKIADEVYITSARSRNTDNKKAAMLQYVISTMLTVIAIVSTLTFASVNKVRKEQVDVAKELVRIKTIQDNNTIKIEGLEKRVNVIELNQTDIIKNWVELNFKRKEQ